MFENLTERLTRTFKNLSGQGKLTEENMQQALREVRLSLLEADVALPVVKTFIEHVKEKALGQDVLLDLMGCKNEEKRIPVRIGEKFHEILINEHEIRNTYENLDSDYVIYENQLNPNLTKTIPNAKKTTFTTE